MWWGGEACLVGWFLVVDEIEAMNTWNIQTQLYQLYKYYMYLYRLTSDYICNAGTKLTEE